jgi:hypothetical protein
MSPGKQQILLSDLPHSLVDRICSVLHSCSTGLIKIKGTTREHGKPILIGSGTLISVDGVYGILTADHVSKEIDTDDALSLLLDFKEHRHSIPRQSLDIFKIARGPIELEGPDLSFIKLPPVEVATIKPYKWFFNLTLHRATMLNNPPRRHEGVWFIQGVPDEMTTEENAQSGLGRVISFNSACGPVVPDKEFSREYESVEYDYIEALAEYNGNPRVPRKFGGISGGGLWQVPIRKATDGTLEPGDCVLSGVVFYESAVRDGLRPIICHGRRSLYEIAYDKIKG